MSPEVEEMEMSTPKQRVCLVKSRKHQGRSHDESINVPSSALKAMKRLPKEVVNQIRSSATITSLSGVILGLVKNSVDAGATRILIDFDFRTGNCVVEDDGFGIPPPEFESNGGLGRMFYTSKYDTTSGTLYGRSGVFLASLSSLCLLRITSHYRQHRSTNSVTFHRSKAVSRLLPAPATYGISNRAHGTQVSVSDLFGDMPVRVKQRGLLYDDVAECDRLSCELRRQLAALLLSCGYLVSLRLRDLVMNRTHNFKSPQTPKPENTATPQPSFPDPVWVQSVFFQSGLPHPLNPKSWVPASASCGSVSIKAIISLEPAPTKQSQFISIGLEPLSCAQGHGDVFTYVNKIFNHSSFGAVNSSEVDPDKLQRRATDERHKDDDIALRKLRGLSKSVDRWPMFCINVRFKHDIYLLGSTNPQALSEASIQAVYKCLDALVSKWLRSNDFTSGHRQRPRKSASSPRTPSKQETRSRRKSMDTDNVIIMPHSMPSSAITMSPATRKRKRASHLDRQNEQRVNLSMSPLGRFTRIKSGQQMCDKVNVGKKDDKSPPGIPRINLVAHERVKDSMTYFHTTIDGEMSPPADRDEEKVIANWSPSIECGSLEDNAVVWEDPRTKEQYPVDARTGQILAKPQTTPRQTPQDFMDSPFRTLGKDVLTLPWKLGGFVPQNSVEWLDTMLKDWKNPVFRPGERPVRQTHDLPSLNDPSISVLSSQQADLTYTETSTSDAHKMSKQALQSLRIIAQVDGKFILAVSFAAMNPLLVLIDQHAADERVQLEDLLSQLVQPAHTDTPPYQSTLGHTTPINYTVLVRPRTFQISPTEADLLETHAAHFADWAILFDIERDDSRTADPQAQPQARVVVRTLPPVIAERSQSEPALLISLLRSEAWAFADAGGRKGRSRNVTRTVVAAAAAADNESSSVPWLRALHAVPPPVLAQLNSRACRSAIMFNDALSRAECEGLVARLARCVFPFQCAHGRPSMVPLVGLGEGAFGVADQDEEGERGFWERWKGWRERAEASGD